MIKSGYNALSPSGLLVRDWLTSSDKFELTNNWGVAKLVFDKTLSLDTFSTFRLLVRHMYRSPPTSSRVNPV